MAKNSNISKEDEPSIAPRPERWYNLRLGHSFRDHHPSSKFCTLRYEFKPASVDKNQPGSLHKKKDNRVTVEFQNNQHGKPKVIFEGVSEDYKENDAVLFFNGETFRLERLHRAVKRLRHVRIPGESATPAGPPFGTSSGLAVESHSPPPGKVGSLQLLSKTANQQQVEIEKIGIGSSDSFGTKSEADNVVEQPPTGETSTSLPDLTNYESEEHIDIVSENDYGLETAKTDNISRREIHRSIDINVPQQDDDDEIADVDVSDDEVNPGFNAAEALRAQVAVEREEHSSSSSSSSGSDSSDSGSESGSGSGSRSGSGSSSSDSESSDGDSVTSI